MPLDWSLPFQLICDASYFAMGVVLGQRKDKKLHIIYYASQTLDKAQRNYVTTKKELLTIVFAFDKLIGWKTIIYTDHAPIRFLFDKKDPKSRLIRWISQLQEFDMKIKDKKSLENTIKNHLSQLQPSTKPKVKQLSTMDPPIGSYSRSQLLRHLGPLTQPTTWLVG